MGLVVGLVVGDLEGLVVGLAVVGAMGLVVGLVVGPGEGSRVHVAEEDRRVGR